LSDRVALAINDALLHSATRNALKLRDDFILLASHELRTPLTALSLQIQLLQRRAKGLNGLVDQLSESASRLSRLVEEMLKLALLARGDAEVNPCRLDLSRLVRDVAGKRSEDIGPVTIMAGRGVSGHWDRQKMEEVIECLLCAANTLSNRKSIHVHVSRSQERARLVVSVGAASRGKEAPRRFPSGESTRTAEQLGLGVYVAHEIVESHGGHFQLRGDLGKDFAFIVDLPLDAAKATVSRRSASA